MEESWRLRTQHPSTAPVENETCPLPILGVYATLGIFLLLAARNPFENRSLIAFTAWSSLVHAAIMAVQAFQKRRNREEMAGLPKLSKNFLLSAAWIQIYKPGPWLSTTKRNHSKISSPN